MAKFSIKMTFRSDPHPAIKKMGKNRPENPNPRLVPRFERESRNVWAEMILGIDHAISIAWLFIDHAVRFNSLHAVLVTVYSRNYRR